MLSPGIKSLGDFTITTAGTQVGDWVEDMEGLLALCAQIRLAYGSGGTSIKAYLQTSIDQETTPVDIWCRTFATASDVKDHNFSALTPTSDISPTDGALADNTAVDGILGDRFRVKIVSVGTYGGSTILSARANVR